MLDLALVGNFILHHSSFLSLCLGTFFSHFLSFFVNYHASVRRLVAFHSLLYPPGVVYYTFAVYRFRLRIVI